MRLRRQPQEPVRRAHPDPKVEAELQRIISLQNAVRRKEVLLDRDQEDIAHLRAKLRNPNWDGSHKRAQHVARLQEEMYRLDSEIRDLHDEISKRVEALSDTEAAYLNAMET